MKRQQIQSNGIGISLDDFGSGNNDMMAVNVFQPNEVKIDRSIITDIHKSITKQEYFLHLIYEFHKKNINVLAEGGECKEELDFLMSTEVDYLQGYYLGMPE